MQYTPFLPQLTPLTLGLQLGIRYNSFATCTYQFRTTLLNPYHVVLLSLHVFLIFVATVHEAGHALYEQGLAIKYAGQPVGMALSMVTLFT